MLHLNTIDNVVRELLLNLCSADYLKDFALAGGTSLALQIGHRKSLDVDMFAFQKVSMQETSLLLENSFTNISIRKTTDAFIFCHINNIKCDFAGHSKYKLVRPVTTIDGIRMYSREDIAAMKLNAICGRGSKKDFYDLYALLKDFSLREMLGFFDYKFDSDNSWMALRSLQYFTDADNQEAPELIIKFPEWDEIKQFLTEEVNRFSFNAGN